MRRSAAAQRLCAEPAGRRVRCRGSSPGTWASRSPRPRCWAAIGNRFRRDVRRFAEANEIPILKLKGPDRSRWDDRKLDHVRPYLQAAERERRFGVVAIVAGRDYQWVFSARNRGKGKAVWFEFFREQRRVGVYYFYILDRDFGHRYVKIATYFPYPARVWLNGHEWAKRQADHAGLDYTALSNGFAASPDPRAAAGDLRRLGARSHQGVLRSLDGVHSNPVDRRRSRRRLLVAAVDPPGRDQPHDRLRRPPPRPRLLRSARGRQHRHRSPRTDLDGLRPPAAPARQDHLRHPGVHDRHRRAHRLSLQALPGSSSTSRTAAPSGWRPSSTTPPTSMSAAALST